MPSKNQLLGSGIPVVEVERASVRDFPDPPEGFEEYMKTVIDMRTGRSSRVPAWRYHKDFPQGKIFYTEVALANAESLGWKDHPGKVRLLSGHEKLYAEEMSKIDDLSGNRQCKLCGESFSSIEQLNEHGVAKHGGMKEL